MMQNPTPFKNILAILVKYCGNVETAISLTRLTEKEYYLAVEKNKVSLCAARKIMSTYTVFKNET